MDKENVKPVEKKPTVQLVPFSYRYVLIDLILRLSAFWLYKIDFINIWLFLSCQIIVISLLTLIYVSTNENGKKWKENFKKTNGYVYNDKIEIEGSAISFIFCIIVICIGTYIFWSLIDNFSAWLRNLLTLITFFVYGFYIMVVYMMSFSKWKEEKINKVIDALSVDGNDERLVKLEVSLSQLSNKVDTYTLESALLGALAFSGFLAILALDKSFVSNIDIFLTQMSLIFNRLIDFNFNNIPFIRLNMQSIQSALAIESIICSLFFLLVIVSRIRFHDTSSEAELYIKIAREFNNKEEEYDVINHHQPSNVIQERLDHLNSEINEKLKFGTKRIKELESIVTYMNYVRNIGLFLFVIILSTAASIVTYKLSIAFFLLYIISYSFHKIDSWAKRRSWKNPFL